MILLGISFQLSMAVTNVVFYLLIISCLVIAVNVAFQQPEKWRQIFRSPLWWVVTIWVVLLYISASYSNADALLWDYARKYIKYLLVGIVTVTILVKISQDSDLPKCFFIGFASGGVITFSLSVINKTTGVLTQLAAQEWFPAKYVANGYWTSNELFAHSLFMGVFFAYGLIIWLRKRQWSGLVFCGMGLFEVFVVSQQRTGFIALIVFSIWLFWMLLPTLKQKIIAIVCVVLVISLTLSTDNKVSHRIFKTTTQWQQCVHIDDVNDENIQRFGRKCRNSIGLRIIFYRDSLAQIKKSWLYGHGLGALDVRTIGFEHKDRSYYLDKTDSPHNEYLLQGIQLGVIGMGLLVAIFTLAFFLALQINKQRRYVYAGIVVMYVVSCLFNSFLLDTTEGLFFALLLSFIIAERAQQKAQEEQ